MGTNERLMMANYGQLATAYHHVLKDARTHFRDEDTT